MNFGYKGTGFLSQIAVFRQHPVQCVVVIAYSPQYGAEHWQVRRGKLLQLLLRVLLLFSPLFLRQEGLPCSGLYSCGVAVMRNLTDHISLELLCPDCGPGFMFCLVYK